MRRRSPASELSGLERAGTMQWVVLVGRVVGRPAWILSFEGWVGNVALEANRGSQSSYLLPSVCQLLVLPRVLRLG